MYIGCSASFYQEEGFVQQPTTPTSVLSQRNNIVQLVQGQQALIQKLTSQQECIMKQQEVIIEKQNDFDQRIASLESKLLAGSSENSSQRRTRIPRQLTVSFNPRWLTFDI